MCWVTDRINYDLRSGLMQFVSDKKSLFTAVTVDCRQTPWISAYCVNGSIWAMGILINNREEVRRFRENNHRTSQARRNIQQTKGCASRCACQVPGTDGGANMTTSPK